MSQKNQKPVEVALGVSYEPDIKRLVERFGAPEPGTLIEYSEVEEVLGVKKDSDRFRGVTGAWRKRLAKQLQIEIVCVRGLGFRALEHRERAAAAFAHLDAGRRKARKAVVVVTATDLSKLTDEERRRSLAVSGPVIAAHDEIVRQQRIARLTIAPQQKSIRALLSETDNA